MNRIAQNIYDDIEELSDLDLQRKLWLNENNDTGLISSFVEVNCRLFDDNRLDDVIDKEVIEFPISNELISELYQLRNLLNIYKAKKSDQEIINDPKWLKVVAQAKEVLRKWDEIV